MHYLQDVANQTTEPMHPASIPRNAMLLTSFMAHDYRIHLINLGSRWISGLQERARPQRITMSVCTCLAMIFLRSTHICVIRITKSLIIGINCGIAITTLSVASGHNIPTVGSKRVGCQWRRTPSIEQNRTVPSRGCACASASAGTCLCRTCCGRSRLCVDKNTRLRTQTSDESKI
jgi:hypothetical protein